MIPCSVVPQRRLVTSKGGWSFALAFNDQAGYPINLTAGGYVIHADFAQPNPVRITSCTVSLTDGVNGLAAALVPQDVVLSTLNPFPSASFISGPQSGPATPWPFRLIVYLVDSVGAKVEGTDQIFPVQPLDPRTTDLTQIPAPDALSIILGPAGNKGDKGDPGNKGDPGGLTPYSGKAAAIISDGQILALTSAGLVPASSDNLGLAGAVCGVAAGSSAAGAAQAYLDTGPYTNSGWTWQMGLPIFVGLGGQMTQSPPSSGFVQRVGVPLSPTSMKIALGPATVIVT